MAPRRCLSGLTVKALATYAVTKSHPRIVCIDRPVGLDPGQGFIERAASGPWERMA